MISPLIFLTKDKDKSQPQKAQSVPTDKKQVEQVQNNQNKNMAVNITTEQVKALRDQTGISIMQCKKALEEAGGDSEKAIVILRKKSGELSLKKADRNFNSGTVQSYIHSNGAVGVLVELNCETDFVANNEGFKALAKDIAMHVAASNPKYVSMNDIPEADKKAAREVFEAEVKGKPDAVREKILQGKLDAYFGEMVLLNQPFVKNPEMTIQALVDAAVQKYGEKTAVGRFIRFKILER